MSHNHGPDGLTRENAIEHMEMALALLTTAIGLLNCVAEAFPEGRDPDLKAHAVELHRVFSVLHLRMSDVVVHPDVSILEPHQSYLRSLTVHANATEQIVNRFLDMMTEDSDDAVSDEQA